MAEEIVWKVIFEDNENVGGSPNTARTQATAGNMQTPPQTNDQKGFFETAFSFFRQILPFAGPLALVIQTIRRSKIFSTFFDAFLTTLGAIVDILMIPLIPILAPALRLLISTLPFFMQISKTLSDMFKSAESMNQGIQKIFNWVGGLFGGIGDILQKVFKGGPFAAIGDKLDIMFQGLGKIFGTAAQDIWKVITDPGKDFFTEKLPAILKIAFQAIVESGKVIWNALADIWKTELWPALWGWIKTTFPDLEKNIKDVKDVFNDIKTIASALADTFRILKTIVDLLLLPLRTIYELLTGGPGGAANFLNSGSNPLKPVGDAIGEGAWKIWSWLTGKAVGGNINQTGMYLLHKGETVTSEAESRFSRERSNKVINIVNNINVTGGQSGAATGSGIASTLGQQIKQISIMGWT